VDYSPEVSVTSALRWSSWPSGKLSMQNFAKFMLVFYLSSIFGNDARFLKHFENFCIIGIIETEGW